MNNTPAQTVFWLKAAAKKKGLRMPLAMQDRARLIVGEVLWAGVAKRGLKEAANDPLSYQRSSWWAAKHAINEVILTVDGGTVGLDALPYSSAGGQLPFTTMHGRLRDVAMRAASNRRQEALTSPERLYDIWASWLGIFDAEWSAAKDAATTAYLQELSESKASAKRFRERRSSIVEPPPRKSRVASDRRKVAATLADSLRAALHERGGDILGNGVRVIADDRFKSYYQTLLSAARSLNIEQASIDDAADHGRIEILSVDPGYGAHKPFRGVRSAIIEFVVRDDFGRTL